MATTRHTTGHCEVLEVSSDVTAIGTTTINVTLPTPPQCHSWQVGVEFYDDAAGTSQQEPTAATATPTATSMALPLTFSAHGMSAIDATANAPESATGYLTAIKVVLSGETAGSATHWRVFAIGSQI